METTTLAVEILPPKKLDPGLETFTKLMDDQFKVLGFSFGINFIIDLLPGIGDIISTIIASYVFMKALEYKISWWALFRMLLNIVIFFIASLIPLFGDFFAAWWKPNRRNLKILRKAIGA